MSIVRSVDHVTKPISLEYDNFDKAKIYREWEIDFHVVTIKISVSRSFRTVKCKSNNITEQFSTSYKIEFLMDSDQTTTTLESSKKAYNEIRLL